MEKDTKSRVSKKILSTLGCFLINFVAIIFMTTSFGSLTNSRYTTLSSFIYETRQKEQAPYSYGKVQSQDGGHYTTFVNTADDVPSESVRTISKNFFLAYRDQSDYLFEFQTPSLNYCSGKMVLYTTWHFESYNMGLELYGKKTEDFIDNKSIYVSEHFADEILGREGKEEDYVSLIDTSLFYDSNELIIKGVIKHSSLNNIDYVTSDSFVLCSYNYRPTFFKYFTYYFLFVGNEISIYSRIILVESAVSKDENLTSYYYNYSPISGYHIGELNNLKEKVVHSERVPVWISVLLIAGYIGYLVLIVMFNSDFKFPKKKWNIVDRKDHSSKYIIFLANFLSLIISLIVLYNIGIINIGNIYIDPSNYNSITFLIINWLALTICQILVVNENVRNN